MSGFSNPAAANTSSHSFRGHRAGDDLPDSMIQVLSGPRLSRSALGQYRLDSLKERHVVAYADRFIMGHSQGEGLGQFAH